MSKPNRIHVLDHGFVDLLGVLGDDATVVNSARVSYGKEIEPGRPLSEKDEKLIKYLINNNHWSPFRHVTFQFRIKAPEAIFRQIYKHQVGMNWGVSQFFANDVALNEISGRYVDMGEIEFYDPSAFSISNPGGFFRVQSKDSKQASTSVIKDDLTVDELDKLLNNTYDDTVFREGLDPAAIIDNDNMSQGVYRSAMVAARESYQKLILNGVAKEQARLVLPLSFYTEAILTTSLQGVLNLIALRDHPHAQFEIQLYAKALKQFVEESCPVSLKYFQEKV